MAKKQAKKKTAPRKADQADRTADGQFAKGNSHGGAREGAGRVPAVVRKAEVELWQAKGLDDKAIETLIALFGHKSGAVRVQAVKLYFDRRFGKARVSIDMKLSGAHVLEKIDAFKAARIATMAANAKILK